MLLCCILLGYFELTAQVRNFKIYPKKYVRDFKHKPFVHSRLITVDPCFTSASSQLPLELLTFEAERLNKEVAKLHWETGSETNIHGFWIQRRCDYENVFSSVTFKFGNGGPGFGADYVLYDENRNSGLTYYQLKMVDMDSSFTMSPIRVVKGYDLLTPLLVFPSPNNASFNIQFNNLTDANFGEMTIIDNLGVMQFNRQISIVAGLNTFQFSQDLTSGQYYLRITCKGTSYFAKFVVL